MHTFSDHSHQAAVVEPGGRQTSYGELLGHIERGRELVQASGMAPGDRVILQAERGVPFTSATIALLLEGLVPVGIEMAQGSTVYEDRARYVRAKMVLTSPKVKRIQQAPGLRRGLGQLGLDVPPSLPLHQVIWQTSPTSTPSSRSVGSGHTGFDVGNLKSEPAFDPESPALIVFTGGTTDKPRGVVLSHRAIAAYLDGLNQLPEWPSIDSIVADHPQQVLYGLAHGKTVYLSAAASQRRSRHVAKLLFQQGVHAYFGSPTAWEAILDTEIHHHADTSPKAVLLGGAPVTRVFLERIENELRSSVSVRCLYGMTELGLVAHCRSADKLQQIRQGCDGDPVGDLLDGVEATVGKDDELVVITPSRFSGYLDEKPVEASEPFATGDIAAVRERNLTLTGRKKDMIIQEGVNLYPGQFESRLLEVFDSAALVGITVDEIGDEAFSLFYTSSSSLNETEALDRACSFFPDAHQPIQAKQLDCLPTTGRQHKLDRQALQAIAQARFDAQTEFPSCLEELQQQTFQDIVQALADASRLERGKAWALRHLALRNLAAVGRVPSDWSSSISPVLPIFILGHQRSGTTFLQRALCQSPNARGMSLADMIAPYPAGWRLSRPVVSVITGGRRLSGTQLERFTKIGDRHHLSLTEPEEEEFLFAALGVSAFIPAAFSQTLGDHRFDALRDRASWPPESLDALMRTYRTILETWLHFGHAPNNTRVISKNPAFGPIAGALAHAFPEAQFVVALRDPFGSIVSRVDLYEAIHDRRLSSTEIAAIVDDSTRQMNGLYDQIQILDPGRVHMITCRQLLESPVKVVGEAASFAGLDPIPAPGLRTKAEHHSRQIESKRFGIDRETIEAAVPGFVALCRQEGEIQ